MLYPSKWTPVVLEHFNKFASPSMDLKWTQHANNIVADANKSLGFLKRNLKTSNTNIKSQAYLSLVRPKLEYACSHCRTLQ
jgi:hypothetical protein